MPPPLECDYESPLSRFQFVIHLAELHSSLTFLITLLFSFLLYANVSTYTAFLAFAIGAVLTIHMARGGRSFPVSSRLHKYQQHPMPNSIPQAFPSDPSTIQQPQLPTLTNPVCDRVAIITGASSGLGLATAQLCMKVGIHVIFAVRNRTKTLAQIQSLPGPPLTEDQYTILDLDLDNLATVSPFVENFTKLNLLNGRLDFLINNAGAMVTKQRLIKVAPVLVTKDDYGNCHYRAVDGDRLSQHHETLSDLANPKLSTTASSAPEAPSTQPQNTQGAEMPKSGITQAGPGENIITHVDNSFLTNHLGHFLLTILLLPHIIKHHTRIVNVSSAIHVAVKSSIQITDCLMAQAAWDAPTAYQNTKMCNIWFTQALQRRLDRISQHSTAVPIRNPNAGGSRVITSPAVFAVHPGTIWSPFHLPFYRETAGGALLWFPLLCAPLARASFKSTTQASLTTLHCCFGRSADGADDTDSPHVGPQPGQLHADCRVAAMSPVCALEAKQEELWELSLLLCRRYVNSANFPLFNSIVSNE